MRDIKFLISCAMVLLLPACASRQEALSPPAGTAPISNTAPLKDGTKIPGAATENAIVAKPAKGSKFAKLKIGMTLLQVEKQIGPPNKQWQHPTSKASIPITLGLTVG